MKIVSPKPVTRALTGAKGSTLRALGKVRTTTQHCFKYTYTGSSRKKKNLEVPDPESHYAKTSDLPPEPVSAASATYGIGVQALRITNESAPEARRKIEEALTHVTEPGASVSNILILPSTAEALVRFSQSVVIQHKSLNIGGVDCPIWRTTVTTFPGSNAAPSIHFDGATGRAAKRARKEPNQDALPKGPSLFNRMKSPTQQSSQPVATSAEQHRRFKRQGPNYRAMPNGPSLFDRLIAPTRRPAPPTNGAFLPFGQPKRRKRPEPNADAIPNGPSLFNRMVQDSPNNNNPAAKKRRFH